MNAHSKIELGKTTVFKLNRSQAVRIPKHLAFPEGVKDLVVRRSGDDLIFSPKKKPSWDDFFDRQPCPDFPERGPQGEYEIRESF
jgi:antitoxin VapB